VYDDLKYDKVVKSAYAAELADVESPYVQGV
jgi:hypothetical protein